LGKALRISRKADSHYPLPSLAQGSPMTPAFKHGESHSAKNTAEYLAWCNMKSRCTNQKRRDWKYYGGMGVTVCERWRNSFANFLADMGRRPPGTSLDRYPDNNGNYEPGNVRWATKIDQIQNRRKRTHCPRGHALTPDNCYVCKWGRHCKICALASSKVRDKKRPPRRKKAIA
jgi:hypothetical protein